MNLEKNLIMNITKEEVNSLGLTLAAFAGSFILKKALEEGYRGVYKEDPPNSADSRDLKWGRLLAWTVVSGVAATAVRIAVKRLGAKKLPTNS